MILGEGVPPEPGLYVVYVNGPTHTTTDRKLAFFMRGEWTYPLSDQRFRDHIYQWVGPLPILRLER